MLRSRASRWTAGTIAVCVLLLVATWFLLVAPRQAQADDLKAQAEQAESANSKLQLDIQQLKADYLKLPARQAEMAKLKQQFPDAVQLPKMIRDLSTMATQAGVSLNTLTPGAPSAVSGAGSGSAAGSAASASGGSNLVLMQVPVSMSVTGDYFQVAAYIKKLQQMPRVMLLSGISLSPSGPNGSVAAALTGQVYVLPDEDSVAATGATPSPSTTASPGASGAAPGNLGGGTATTVSPSVQTTAPRNP